jgi:hypothetical protein
MKKTLTFFLVFIFCTKLFGQKEWSNWYQSGYHLLTFKNGYPELVQGFINPLPQPTDFLNFQWWAQMSGSVSYSDPVTGEMKFIISNRLGFGADYNLFPIVHLYDLVPAIYFPITLFHFIITQQILCDSVPGLRCRCISAGNRLAGSLS